MWILTYSYNILLNGKLQISFLSFLDVKYAHIGQKTRRNWQCIYVVILETLLLFARMKVALLHLKPILTSNDTLEFILEKNLTNVHIVATDVQ